MSTHPEDRSLPELRRRFRRLPAPGLAEVAGIYAGSFPRPAAYGRACRSAMAMTGLPAWRGKRFAEPAPGAAEAYVVNLVRGGREVKPLLARIASSVEDGEPALVCTYRARETPPYRWIRDEFRRWDERTLLALSFLDVPVLRGPGLPFVLRRIDGARAGPRPAQATKEVAMSEEHKPPEDDEAADVSAAGQAASATPGATLGDDPDPELVEAAEAAQRPDDEE